MFLLTYLSVCLSTCPFLRRGYRSQFWGDFNAELRNDFCSFRRVICLLTPCLNCYVFLHFRWNKLVWARSGNFIILTFVFVGYKTFSWRLFCAPPPTGAFPLGGGQFPHFSPPRFLHYATASLPVLLHACFSLLILQIKPSDCCRKTIFRCDIWSR